MLLDYYTNATECNLFITATCFTCFGWYLHPSSGAHNTVSRVSGINGTVTATCRERGWTGKRDISMFNTFTS